MAVCGGSSDVLWLKAEAGLSPRQATSFSLLRQRKGSKRKATHSQRPLRVATGQTCAVAVAGCAVELALRCARRSDNHGESVDEACALRRACHPETAPTQAPPDGGMLNTANSQQPTATRAIAALGTGGAARGGCARALHTGRAKQRPVWMSAPWVPFCVCREAQGRGCVRVPKDTRTSSTDSPQLFERSA